MVDIDIDTQSIENAAKLQTIISNLNDSIPKAWDAMKQLFGTDSQKNINDSTKAGMEFSTAIGKVTNTLSDINTKDISQLHRGLDIATAGSEKLMDSLLKVGAFFTSNTMFNDFGKQGAAGINTVSEHAEALTALISNIGTKGGLPQWISNAPQKFIENAAQAEKLENAYIGIQSATGQMNSLFDKNGSILKDLSSITAGYVDHIGQVGASTGMSSKQILDYANQLREIPHATEDFIKTSNDGKQSTDSLTSALRLMTGSGQSFEEVAGAMKMGYDDLSNAQGKVTDGAQKGQQYFATLSTITNTLGLNFDYVKKVMAGVAEEFKFVGDNTAAAANIFSRYTQALQNTGLSASASSELVGKLIGNIKGLSVAQEAYISKQSGGPGGLQGAFKIEQLERQGKTDQVMQMMESTFRKQAGGRLYSMDEAASNPQAAGQFMKQRTMLQSGVFGIGKGMDNDQATHLLESLKNRNVADFKKITTGAAAVGEVGQKGAAIQDRNNDLFKQMANSGERAAMSLDIIAGATIKQLVGTTGKSKGLVLGGMEYGENQAMSMVGEKGQLQQKTEMNAAVQLGKMGREAASAFAISMGGTYAAGKGAVKDMMGSSNMQNGPKFDQNDLDNLNKARTKQMGGNQVLQAVQNHPNAHPYMGKMPQHTGAQAHSGGAQGTVMMAGQNVHLNIAISAPDGFNVTAQSPSSNVSVGIQQHNSSVTTGTVDIPKGHLARM